MNKTQVTTTAAVCASVLFAAAWFTNAGPINPPGGPVSSTGVTTQELADLITGGDPCQCEGLTFTNLQLSSSATLLSTGQNYYIKRISLSKTDPSATVRVNLRDTSRGLNFGFYTLTATEGSLTADVDLVVDGLSTSLVSVSSGAAVISYTYKTVP